MRKILLLFIGLIGCVSVEAQLAKWVIHPVFNSLSVKVDNRILATDSAGWTSLWTFDGKRIFETEHEIQAFNEGVATIVEKNTRSIIGFIDMSGTFTALPDMEIAYDDPYFHDGYLCFKDGDSYGYCMRDGNVAYMAESVKSYPFHSGYAPYLTFAQMDKRKDPYYGYHTSGNRLIYYRIYNGEKVKDFEPDEISFLSGIGPNGKGVAVIKNKLYWFSASTGMFEPLLWGDEESEKRRHLTLEGDYRQYFLSLPSDSVVIRAKYGRKQKAVLRFDNELVPARFTFDDEDLLFETSVPTSVKYETSLSSYGKGQKGLSMNSKPILPQQFDEVSLMYGNRAFVKKQGRWGILEILPDLTYQISVNKGEDIAFRHQKFETQVRLDLPAEISAKEARIDIPESTGCIIDKTSRETKDTESGNFVVYNCSLNIPRSLPDTITEITYSPMVVSYDGISMFDSPIRVRAWHLKYYNVDPIDSETTVDNGVASFTININAQRNVGEGDYPFEVRIEADSITVDYEKISETRYKCTVYNLQEGDNSLNIFVTEKGCPSSIFPFEITYTKPVPKKKEKEKVVIRKKSAEAKKESSTPRLEI